MGKEPLSNTILLSVGRINLHRDASEPLHLQLYRALREKILSRTLLPGEKLPSSRNLAEELQLGRNTVVNAYNRLAAEGFLESAVGSGTIVSSRLPEEFTAETAATYQTQREMPSSQFFEENSISLRGQKLMDVPHLEETCLAPFTLAHPFIDERFVTVWGSLMARAWRRMTPNQFGYPSALGYNPLREAVAAYLRTSRGVRCVSHQIIITDGAQQALNIIAQLLVNPGENVWIEDPSYDGAKAAFRSVGANLVPVEIDENGFHTARAMEKEPRARLAYVSPSNQYPMGVTMSLERRLQLIAWASENKSWIIEDDYDSEFRYEGPPVMSLQGIDRSERVIYIGTFSKVLYPGLRLGYIAAPVHLVEPLSVIRAHTDRGSPILQQIVLNDYIRGGHFTRHIRRMRRLYAGKRRALAEAVNTHLGDIVTPGSGTAGLHIVVHLAPGVNDVELSRALHIRGYVVPALSSYALLPRESGGLLLGFTALDLDDMDDAVARLRPVIADTVSRSVNRS